MKRVGKRGEGKFVRISWEEALDTVGNSLRDTLKIMVMKLFMFCMERVLTAVISPIQMFLTA